MVVAFPRLGTRALLLVLFGVCHGRHVFPDCPSSDIIHPCRCSATILGLRVICTRIANEQTLRNLLAYLSNYRMNALTLHNINFTVTPDLFSRLQVVTVKITESEFRMKDTFTPGRPAIASGVEDLDVRLSTLDLGNGNLAVMRGLRRVVVDASNITVLKRSWFDGLSRLTQFAIENTQLGRLEDRALAGLYEVHSIILTADGLKYLRRSYFPPLAAKLAHLDFSDNRLTSLPTDMFDNMPVLETVLLSRNKFKTLSPAPWRPMLRQLVSIKLDGNPIDCSGNISWLLQSDVRHKISGTCLTPRHLAGINLYELNDTRYSR